MLTRTQDLSKYSPNTATSHCYIPRNVAPGSRPSVAPAAQGKGYIECAELQVICKNLGEELSEQEVNNMVREAISNFDGKIYYDGFKKIMIAH